jgi:uncharacterized protein YjbI with pentapeptide repeats
MANMHHFEILKQGAEVWNEWYSSHPEVIADLSGLCLAGFDLGSFVLTGANLAGADLRSADMSGADLRGAVLKDTNMDGATLDGADLRIASGLTETVLAAAEGNSATRLPDNVERPSKWGRATALVFENAELVRALFSGSQQSRASH